jgi:hypothetical protein
VPSGYRDAETEFYIPMNIDVVASLDVICGKALLITAEP